MATKPTTKTFEGMTMPAGWTTRTAPDGTIECRPPDGASALVRVGIQAADGSTTVPVELQPGQCIVAECVNGTPRATVY